MANDTLGAVDLAKSVLEVAVSLSTAARWQGRPHQYVARPAPRARNPDPTRAHLAVPSAWPQLEDAESDVPDPLRPALAEICSENRDLERPIRMIEQQLAAIAVQTPAVAQLMTIPGIGLLIATALVAFVGNIRRFPLRKALRELRRPDTP